MIPFIGKASANGSVPKDKGKGAKKEEKSTGGDALAKEFLEVSKEVSLFIKV